MSEFRPLILVPHFNHLQQFERYLGALLDEGVALLVVDDGSEATQRQRLSELAEQHGFHLQALSPNAGKGAAVMAGFEYALAQGYTHAFQVDADGQHDTADIQRFLKLAKTQPGTLICGAPVFGKDAPWIRVWGRKLTDLVVFLETWKTGIKDALCGFRVYPLGPVLAVIQRSRPGDRMDFDADMLVRAQWAHLPLHFEPTAVAYPEQGLSHFRYVADNLAMVRLHLKLLLIMMLRSPKMLWERLNGRSGSIT